MNILMIGNNGSGKTTYMASAFFKLAKGVEGFYIRTDDSSRQWFERLAFHIENGNYPSATDKRNSYEFRLYYHHRKVLDFSWIDYNGGIITQENTVKMEEDINQAEGMMIFLEAEALWKNLASVHKFRRIFALLTERLENNDVPLFSVIIVLTKYDKIPNHISIDDVTATIKNFIQSAKNSDKVYTRVVPVSCTSSGFFNVKLPLLDILDSGIRIEYTNAVIEAKLYYEAALKADEDRGIIDWAISKLFGMKTNGEISEDLTVKSQEKINLFKSLESPIQNLTQYIKNYKIIFPNNENIMQKKASGTLESRFVEL